MQRDTTCAADGEGRPHRCSHEEVSKRSIISSKHSSTAHLWFFHRLDNILDDASRMTIATSGSHLRGQHDVGGRNVGGPHGGGGKGHKGQSHQSILTQATIYRLLC